MTMRTLVYVLSFTLTLSGCAATSVSGIFNDARNESLVKKRIDNAHPALKDANISVNSFDGIVLITGQVPSVDLIPIATAEAEPLRNVRKVHNELQVAGETTVLSRTNDSWLTTKVKSALTANEDTDVNRIKVVTENEVVYLMGRLTLAEADAAVKVTRDIQGVQKIVKVFEYIN
ncbi:MAG: BON domain-containing protein [Pseudomonadales bacterium]|nr:BON domain-containing protein [Pseudomonadales bacterium]MBO6564623.1 BON domain-containing protein [Pseudomonadales bacterium]MBO6594249.1 BON domain-containing protein [Pseudomonadales bacterium]MBO6656288.1 BON domain-containing protein [Pseudomonadales bacterium]MBO6700748.1 BON domain-containing protein [Pseudomonadales bacterium]